MGAPRCTSQVGCHRRRPFILLRCLSPLITFPQKRGPLSQLKIHIYDRLCAPHGLVRYGVAPDHPEVKARFSPYPRFVTFKAVLFTHRTARTSSTKLRLTLAYASLATSRSGPRRRHRSHTPCQYPSPL